MTNGRRIPSPLPPPKASAGHRARSAPPSTTHSEEGNLSFRDTGDSQADSPEPPSQQSRSNRRVCKKAPPPHCAIDPVPPKPKEEAARQPISSTGGRSNAQDTLTWDQISELARKPMSVERYLPRPCKGLFEQVLARCLVATSNPHSLTHLQKVG